MSPLVSTANRAALCGAIVLATASVSLSACQRGETTEVGTQGEGDSSESGESGEGSMLIPARGDIELTSVVINQAVDVPIAARGEAIAVADRNTYVVATRDTLLRGFWEIPEDWQDRTITAQLVLEYPDGSTQNHLQTLMIDGPSFAGDLKRSFSFPLFADQFPPGLGYHLSLWEAEPGAEDQRESTTVLESPLGGAQPIGIEPDPVQLKVVLMPVAYEIPGCSTSTADYDTVTQAHEQTFIDFLHEQYPVQEVILDYRRDSPIQWGTELTSLSQLWQPLRDLRTADNADPNVYYYALVDVCDNAVDGAGGIAPGLASDLETAGFERVSVGLWTDHDTFPFHTMVHELGHNHGRAHVFCAGGNASGTDSGYPHDDGIIGVWGFGIRQIKLHSPTGARDFMTYCSPNWVSDWGWSKAFDRIRTLTSWDFEAPSTSAPSSDEVLIGLLFKNGEEQWYTTPGAESDSFYTSGNSIRFAYGSERLDAPTNTQILDDGTQMITARVPRPRIGFTGATRFDAGGHAHAIELSPSQAWMP